MKLPLKLSELVLGCTKTVQNGPKGRPVVVRVPAGSRSGQVVGVGGLKVRLKRSDAHDSPWRRDGWDLYTTVILPFGIRDFCPAGRAAPKMDGRTKGVLMPPLARCAECLRDRTPLVVANEGVKDALGRGGGHLFVQCQFELPQEGWFESWAAAGKRVSPHRREASRSGDGLDGLPPAAASCRCRSCSCQRGLSRRRPKAC